MKNVCYIAFNRTKNYNYDIFVKSIEPLIFPKKNIETVLSWPRISCRSVVFVDSRDKGHVWVEGSWETIENKEKWWGRKEKG